MMFKIGDGTAPPGFPAYGKFGAGIICNFNHCHHKGSMDVPSKMECDGINCKCPCCQMLAGKKVFGCSYGRKL